MTVRAPGTLAVASGADWTPQLSGRTLVKSYLPRAMCRLGCVMAGASRGVRGRRWSGGWFTTRRLGK